MIAFWDYAAINALRAAPRERGYMSLPAGNYSPASITIRDRSDEVSVFQCYGTILTAANFVAQQALFTTLRTAIDAIVLGVFNQYTYGVQTIIGSTFPLVNTAQRENKLLVQYVDDTNQQRFTATIPTIDLDALTFQTNAGDFVDLATPTAVSDFVTAFEAFAVSPVGNHSVTVRGLKFVGRNS
jgi:hypothetical protein